jgi:putative heme-binding domain-containing protein
VFDPPIIAFHPPIPQDILKRLPPVGLSMNRLFLSLLALLLLVPESFGQANATIPNPDPELERKTFILPEGFEVNLFAADPLLAKPIQMNFDPQGRLWVASSEIYPQIKPGQVANDKVLILEDTDGDGKADKTTVFADGLLIPTGIEPGDGGAYVANSTELVHLSASKLGGKADKTRVVLSGFGTEDTHHIIHTFRWGNDGCLYFNQSIYIHSHVETPHGVKRLNAGGIWRFRPETMGLDVLVRGFVNTWGHHTDRWGQSLATDGAYGEGVNHCIPGAHFVTAVGSAKLWKGLNPGSPKHCGLEIVSGRHLPDDWQGNAITNDFRGHRVCRFKLGDDGTSFTSREMTEVIKSNHPAFRPIDVKMGPDGAIYIADWYNPIIQHGEVDFRDPRRDHTHGRIWRVTAKGRPLVKKPDLVGGSTLQVLDHLKDPEEWTRRNAKRVLKERGAKEVLPVVAEWVKKLDPKHADFEHHLLEALWVYQTLDTINLDLLGRILNATEPRARAAATRVLTLWRERLPSAESLLAQRALDDSPQVRMEAVRGLAELGTPKAAELAFKALDKPTDRGLEYALYLTARDLEPAWMPAFRDGKIDFGGNVKHLTFALESVGSKEAAKPILDLIRSGKLPKDRESALWVMLAKVGGPKEIDEVLDHGLDALPTAEHTSAVAAALEESARQRKVGPSNLDAPVVDELQLLVNGKNVDARRSALRLIGLWKVQRYSKLLVELAANPKAVPEDRRAAFEGLALIGDQATLLEQAAKGEPAAARSWATIPLAGISLPQAVTLAVGLMTDAKPGDDLSELFAAFLTQKGGSAQLAKAIDGKKLHPDIAKLGLRAVRSSVQDAKPLTDALVKAGGLAVAKTEYTAEEIKGYVADVMAKGDAARGELVYRRKEATCLTCHAIQGAGGLVGPDMTSIGASAQIDYLVESILLPNKAVKEGYHAMKITLLNGKQVNGIKTREADGKLYLRTADDKELVIVEKDIDEKSQSRSLMPDGLGDQLTRQEFVDLIKFLSELGKIGNYAPNKARVFRKWQIFEASNDNMNLLRRQRAAAAAENPSLFLWTTNYTKVSGELPLDALPKLTIWNGTEPIAMLQAQIDATTAGPVKLKFNSVEGLTLHVGPTPVEVKPETVIEVKPGTNVLTISLNMNLRKNPVKVELEDVQGSPARAGVVNGK